VGCTNQEQCEGFGRRKEQLYFEGVGLKLGWRQDNGNQSNQESKFDFLTTRQCLVKIDEGQQKRKIVRTNRQSNLRVPANQFSPSAGTTLG